MIVHVLFLQISIIKNQDTEHHLYYNNNVGNYLDNIIYEVLI